MKTLHFYMKFVSALGSIALVLASALLFGTKAIGFIPYAVLSGSMSPKYPVGAMVYARETPIDTIEIGDDIAFYISNGKQVVTHRVVGVAELTTPSTTPSTQGTAPNPSTQTPLQPKPALALQTQGIANETPDAAPVQAGNLIGKIYFSIPYLGKICTCLAAPPYRACLTVGCVAWIILCAVVKGYDATPAKHSKPKHASPKKQFAPMKHTTRPKKLPYLRQRAPHKKPPAKPPTAPN